MLSSCSPSGLADEDPKSKTVMVAGSAGYLSESSVAYLASVYVPFGIVTPAALFGDSPSGFIGFGPGGQAIGYEYYAPLHQNSFFSGNAVPAIYHNGRLVLLQPNCDAAAVNGCLTSIESVGAQGIIGLCGGWQNCFLNAGRTTMLPTAQGSEFQGVDYKFVS